MNYRDLILESYLEEDNDYDMDEYEAYDEDYDDEYEAYDEEYDDDEALEAYLEGYYYAIEMNEAWDPEIKKQLDNHEITKQQAIQMQAAIDSKDPRKNRAGRGQTTPSGNTNKLTGRASLENGRLVKNEYASDSISKDAREAKAKNKKARKASKISQTIQAYTNRERNKAITAKAAEKQKNYDAGMSAGLKKGMEQGKAVGTYEGIQAGKKAAAASAGREISRLKTEVGRSRDYGFKSGERVGYEKGNTAGTKKGRVQGAAVAGGTALAVAGGVAAAKAIKLDKEYKAYQAAGGKLSKKEWIAKGKPSATIVEKAVAKIKHEAYNEIADAVYEDAFNEGYDLAIAELWAEEDDYE